MIVLSWLIHCVLILLTVAFFTLFERNVIGLFHLRVGPNNVSFVGIVQPLLDAFKLLSNQDIYPLRSNKVSYFSSPLLSLSFSLLVWLSLPIGFNTLSVNFSLLVFFLISSFIVFPVLLSGWSSNSNYSLIGSLRSIAQSISYEAVFSTLLIIVCLSLLSFSCQSHSHTASLLNLIFLPLWVVCTLAETHRAPFDFSESESELVSGFNTEYSGAFFAFIFLSEYGVLLFSCIFITLIFLSHPYSSVITCVSIALSLSFIFIWIRITFCRFRYDLLILVAWNVLLPMALLILLAGSMLFLFDHS